MNRIRHPKKSRSNSVSSVYSSTVSKKKASDSLVVDNEDDNTNEASAKDSKTQANKQTEPGQRKGKIEDQLNNDNMQKLQKIFEQADEDQGGGLDIEEFGNALKMAFQHELDDRQLNLLFMKVDTNCDGSIDWEEFCNYMLLQNQQKDCMVRDLAEMPFPHPKRIIPTPHHDMFVNLAYLPSFGASCGTGASDSDADLCSGRYISCSKDGMLIFWSVDFKIQKCIMIGDFHLLPHKTRPIWVTSLVVLGNAKKLAVATTESDVTFYDYVANSFEKQFMITGFPHCVVSMDYWHNPKNINDSLILFGDVGGGVSCIKFNKASKRLFDANIGKISVLSSMAFRVIPYQDLFKQKHNSVKSVAFQRIHDDWVRKVKYIPNLQCFISCSSGTNKSLYLGDLDMRKTASYFRVRKGVYTFDYDKENNLLISGGPDRIIRLWNPYVTNKAIAILRGHVTPIYQIIVDRENQQIISISKDKMIKIWDMEDQLCIQTIPSRLVCRAGIPITVAFYNPKLMTLLLGGASLILFEKRAKTDFLKLEDGRTSHSRSLCAALYNDLFKEVVSACHGGIVNVWQLETGEKLIMFKVAEREIEITTIAFDPTKRRLITGTRDGTVKLWNFHNGACLRQLQGADDNEITSTVWLKRIIVYVGWNKQIKVFNESAGEENEVPKTISHVHKDDILCIDMYNSSIVATASYDGQIAVWNLETGRIFYRFDVNNLREFKTYQGDGTQVEDAMMHVALPSIPTEETALKNRIDVRRISFKSKTDPKKVELASEEILRHANEHLSVDKVLFLRNRANSSETATLLTSAGGVILAWSVHGGGLLGKFQASHVEGESVHGMVTDSDNKLLITGDRMGYIAKWDISNYAIRHADSNEALTEEEALRRESNSGSNTMLDKKVVVGEMKSDGQSGGAIKRMKRLSLLEATRPPEKLLAFRGHTECIVSVDYAEDKELMITASADCTVRVWTAEGQYVGTFGQNNCWSLSTEALEVKRQRLLPLDLQRMASNATLEVLIGSSKKWRTAANTVKFLGTCNAALPRASGAKDDGMDVELEEPELFSYLRALKSRTKDVLGKEYKPKKRRKVKSIEIKQKIIQNQCIAYSSLPYCELGKIPEYPLPEVLAKRQVEKHANPLKQDATRCKGFRKREESDLQGLPLYRRYSFIPK